MDNEINLKALCKYNSDLKSDSLSNNFWYLTYYNY